MIGLTCWKREDVAPHFGFFGPCSPLADERKPCARHRARIGDRHVGLPPDGSRLREERVLHSQSGQSQLAPVRDGGDLTSARTDPAARSPEPEHRRRQAHLPRRVRQPDQVDTRQTPREASRGSLLRRAAWTRPDAFIPTTDADGHFAGGVRLPHVESTVHGRVAGAPLGRHAPLNPAGLDPFHPFVFLGGTFTRFSDDELLSRYASRRQYVKRVKRAADHLAAKGYISNKDRKALIAAAEDEPLPVSSRG